MINLVFGYVFTLMGQEREIGKKKKIMLNG